MDTPFGPTPFDSGDQVEYFGHVGEVVEPGFVNSVVHFDDGNLRPEHDCDGYYYAQNSLLERVAAKTSDLVAALKAAFGAGE